MKTKTRSIVIAAAALLAVLPVQNAFAENKFLLEGISKYNAGEYSDAVGLLGAAENSEYNNAILHYYMADALLHLNQKETAIREYKIAMALEPQGKMAQYCESALRSLGALPVVIERAGRTAPTEADIRKQEEEKAHNWLAARIAEVEAGRKQQLDALRDKSDKQLDLVNKQAASDKQTVIATIPQFSHMRGMGTTPNPDYQQAMQAIESDTVNKQNAINMDFKHSETEINRSCDERIHAYQETGTVSENQLVKSTVSGDGGPPVSASASQRVLKSVVPSITTAFGRIPISHVERMQGRELQTIYVNLDSDGSWGTGNNAEKWWKAELIDQASTRAEWQAWQSDIANTILTLLMRNGSVQLRDCHLHMIIDRNGKITKINTYESSEGLTDSGRLAQLIKTQVDGFDTMPSTSRFEHAEVNLFVTKNPDMWWK